MAKFWRILFSLLLLGACAIWGGLAYVLHEYGSDLPDSRQLADYEPPVTTRVYAGDGRLLSEYAMEKRVFMPLAALPLQVTQAFLSAEDKSFYQHSGLDFMGIIRAIVINLRHYGTHHKPMGASTITQQVAKNFLLTSELSLERKIKEAILASRIENMFLKDHILELYLNEIYLGFSSYGVAAAAIHYFHKSLEELSVAEAAFLAALPKAPNNYHPLRHPIAARERRDWVLDRMAEDGHITAEESVRAQSEPLIVPNRAATEVGRSNDHLAEEVRRLLRERYGEYTLYKGGLHVRTTLDPEWQMLAEQTLRSGLIKYDRRHGWRGSLSRIQVETGWIRRLYKVRRPIGLPAEWALAVVLALDTTRAAIGLLDGRTGVVPLSELTWARPWQAEQTLGPPIQTVGDVLGIGDIVAVEALWSTIGYDNPVKTIYSLCQVPQVEGALVALDPHTGRILAMVGGFSYSRSEFNRATQALRQPGSAFKPFVYLAALDNGYTPSQIVLDAPFVVAQGLTLPKWKPQNYDGGYLGPMTLRLGIEQSRNLVTARLAQAIGMPIIADYARRFGIADRLPQGLAMSLGAAETTVLRLTGAYAMLVNGGKQIQPTFIDRIQNRSGHTIYRHDHRLCTNCRARYWNIQPMPVVPDTRTQVTDPLSAYQMVSLLQGAVQYGTGRNVAAVGRPLAGKTGTSNDNMDAWFVGFSPDLVVGVFVGFDEPRSLGLRETGSSVAAPIFRDFMQAALAGRLATDFRMPAGIRLVRVSHATGIPAPVDNQDVIVEAFKPGTVPESRGHTTVLSMEEIRLLEPLGDSGNIALPPAPDTDSLLFLPETGNLH
ncbi:Multimodular transpeptidase-transglycosylase [invertebrate metagenome]|uniref:Penicillin-binding protein 1A n=1 Tax=invertebrate metagenome TaxID=1711999 RepID=A0A484H7X2_9ZZZZ